MSVPEKEFAAWLVDCGEGVLVALGIQNVLHVVEDMNLLFKVPLAPAHCNHVLVWQKRLLPVVNLSRLFSNNSASARKAYSCVLGWRGSQGETEYGVLLSRTLPRRVLVSDEHCVEPNSLDGERWRDIALGFFSYHKHTTPIIDPAVLFGSAQALNNLSESGRAHRIA